MICMIDTPRKIYFVSIKLILFNLFIEIKNK